MGAAFAAPIEPRIERKERGEPLGGVRVGTTVTGGHHGRDLSGGEHDVWVVGQDDDLARVHRVDGFEQLAVLGLATAHP